MERDQEREKQLKKQELENQMIEREKLIQEEIKKFELKKEREISKEVGMDWKSGKKVDFFSFPFFPLFFSFHVLSL